MTMPRRFCMVLAALAATAVATAVAIGFSVASAGAAAPGLCGVVPVLCPPTTPPRTAPPTTVARVAPATTTAHAPLTPVVKKAASTAARSNAPAVASVGAGGLSVNAADIGVPALASNDAAAPELAPAAAPELAPAAAPASIRAPTPTALSGLVGAAANPLRGLPDYHSRMRIALSVLVLLVAAVAAAQLPESRRSPQRKPPAT